MTKPKTGLHRVTDDEYFGWDAVSNSRLSLLNRSPAHFRQGFKESTPALRLGSLIHAGVLEWKQLIDRYVFMPDYSNHPDNKTAGGDRSFSKTTKFVKEREALFRDLHHDKEIVTQAEYDKLIGMSEAFALCPEAKELLTGGESEVAVVWDDPLTGMRCKAKIDYLRDDAFIDVKTTRDGQAFDRAIANYGYHRQAAFYQRGVAAVTGKRLPCYMMPIESSAPYCVRVAQMSEAAIAVGNGEVDALLLRLKDCYEKDEWLGYDSPSEWTLPDWYNRSDEQGGDLVDWFDSMLETFGGES
jgi:hypothetical protein